MLVQHFKSLLMPAYRSISYVKVGDGSETSFWEDQWVIDTTLAAKGAFVTLARRPGYVLRMQLPMFAS